ncbi:hypothetical protein [Shinella sp.]|uniref:hypothetical protein n=1 Tax=Shinella sp. TaxID=1870904 RepID=UPI003F709882
MSQDSKDNAVNANNGLSDTFNRKEKLAHEIAKLSPSGLQICKKIEAVAAERLENEKRQQQRFHSHRVLKEKVGLLENYIREQSEKPAEIKADPSADLKIIQEQSERIVADREQFYLRTIEREADANLWQVVSMERGGHNFSAEMGEHEQDMER